MTPPRPAPAPGRVRTLGVDVDRLDRAGAVERILAWCRAGESGLVVTPNLDHAVRLAHDPSLRAAYAKARLVLADGMPLVWASRLAGAPLPERVAGSDLIEPLLQGAARDGLSVFLLGSRRETLERAARALGERAPGLRIAGLHAPGPALAIDGDESRDVVRRVAAAAPDLLLVGLGSPKQELWAARWRSELPARAVVCVGAGLDFLGGAQQRAPKALRRLGLEWLYRLLRHPLRLGPRYATDLLALGPLLVRQLREQRRGGG